MYITTRNLLISALLTTGCADNKPPKIGIDLSPIWLGIHEVDSQTPGFTWNLIISNIGGGTLELDPVGWRADQSCSFTFEGPDRGELEAGDSAFVQGIYDPAAPGYEQIVLEFPSNATNFDLLEVPVCAQAINPGDPDPVVPELCEPPPTDQPDCA